MWLYQGIVDVMKYLWRNKRFNSLNGANNGGNLCGWFVDMTMPCHVIINKDPKDIVVGTGKSAFPARFKWP